VGVGHRGEHQRVSSASTSHPGPILDRPRLAPPTGGQEPVYWGLTPAAWLKVMIAGALLVALFRFNLARLWSKTNPFTGDANWGHAPIVPLIGLYYLYLNRDALLAAPVKPILFERLTRVRLAVTGAAIAAGALAYFAGPSVLAALLGPSDIVARAAQAAGAAAAGWGVLCLLLGWGLGNLLFGLLVFAIGIFPGQNDWVCDYGMVHTLFGVVLTLCGWAVMRVAWFPIAFLVCALPWPGLVYSWLASPLQHLAATVAVKTLNFTGIESVRSGTKMFITGADGLQRPLNVAEACAGLRSLMTFISVAAAVAFLSTTRAMWQKVLITASAVPIAIFCNVLRVTGQAYLDRLAGPQWYESFAHQFVGVVMLVPAFFLILMVCWVLDHLFVDDDDAAGRAGAKERDVIVVAPRTRGAVVAKTQAAPGAAPVPAGSGAGAAPSRLPPRVNLTGKSSASVESQSGGGE
jgi:exosortase